MADQFRIEVDDEQVLAKLTRAVDQAENLSPLMGEIEGILIDAIERAFKNEQDPETGAPWAELSSVTKARRGAGAKKLQDSGSLVQSIGGKHDALSAEAGVAEKYGITHQLGAAKGEYGKTSRGAPIPWGDIPARPFLGFNEDDRREILDVVSQYISGAFE